jgi:hypothetical protein
MLQPNTPNRPRWISISVMRTATWSSTSARRARYLTALHRRCLPTPHHSSHPQADSGLVALSARASLRARARILPRCIDRLLGLRRPAEISLGRDSLRSGPFPPQCPSRPRHFGLMADTEDAGRASFVVNHHWRTNDDRDLLLSAQHGELG